LVGLPAIEQMNEATQRKSFLGINFWRTASGFWRDPGFSGARLFSVGLIAFSGLQLLLQYRLNYWSRDFFDAFGRRDSGALWSEALLFLLLAGLSVLTAALVVWARMTVQRRWRAWLTRHLIERWLASKRSPNLHTLLGEDQSPEYRIATDTRIATDAPVSMAMGLLTSLLGAVVFIAVLWQ